MAKLKAFYAGQNYRIADEVRDLLGQPTHVRFGAGLIVAQTKAAAVAFADDLRRQGQPVHSPYATEMHVSTSYDTEALRAAGLFDEPAIFIKGLNSAGGSVVRVTADGVEVVGQLVRVDASKMEFEPAGTLHVTFTPDAVQALRALLDLVHYDDLTQQWRDMLPCELLALPDDTKE